MAKRRLNTLGLSEELQRHCVRHGLRTVQEVLELQLLDIMQQLRLNAQQARALQLQLAQLCAPRRVTAWDMLQEDEGARPLPSGHGELDVLLAGGFQRGTLTELAGPPGVGKTQWCISLAAQCVLGSGGSPAPVIYIDTEATLTPQRVVEVLTQRLSEHDQARLPELLADIVVHRPASVEHLHKILEQLELQCLELRAKAVFVDSIASLARQEFPAHRPGRPGGHWQKTLVLAGWAAKLKTLAANCKLSVVVTNQVTSRGMSFSDDVDEEMQDDDEKVTMPSDAPSCSLRLEESSSCHSVTPSSSAAPSSSVRPSSSVADSDDAKPSVCACVASSSNVDCVVPQNSSHRLMSPAKTANFTFDATPEEVSTLCNTASPCSTNDENGKIDADGVKFPVHENFLTRNKSDSPALEEVSVRYPEMSLKRAKSNMVHIQSCKAKRPCVSVPEADSAKVQGSLLRTGKYKYVTPALGNTWTHFVNTRLIFQYTADLAVRQLVIVKSPVSPLAVFDYTVTPAGVLVTGRGKYSNSGCDPNLVHIAVEPGPVV
ncbi:DNA recombination and repair protein Rad51-like C-terminal [Trinorchestia longiramus]|nr:DNA recombination and repair protein Rad51-like C-terminal [Trinorchestia longiramus]